VSRDREVALEVDGDHGIPLVLGHVHEHPVAEDSGVVDEDVEPAELVDRLPHEALRPGEAGDVLAIRRRLAARGADLLHDLLRGARVRSLAGEPGAEVVDHELRSGPGEGERVRAADPAPGARDDRDLAAQIGHSCGAYARTCPQDTRPVAATGHVR
jgi:hypothetical protein